MAKSDTIPTPEDLIGPAIDATVARRPAALRHLNNSAKSRYARLVSAWGAQSVPVLARLNDELRQRFLPTASGSGLRELVSEPDFGSLIVNESPTKAAGEATISRPGGAVPTGVVPKGTRWRRRGNPRAVPLPITAAEYVTSEPVVIPFGALTATLPIVAVSTGTASNIVPETGVTSTSNVELADTIYDAESGVSLNDQWTLESFTAAGGSNGLTDADIRRIARGQGQGQSGPTDAAIVAGILRGTGVRHHGAFRSMLDDDSATRPNTRIFVADPSWASSSRWRDAIVQTLLDEWAGFGCRVTSGTVTNTFIRVEPTIQLRSARLLTNTAAISEAVRLAVRSYFDDRAEWWSWTLPSLRSAITAAHRSILTCTSVAVKDRNGNVLIAPTVDQSTATSIAHFYLLGDGLVPTFQAPV